MFPDVTNSNDEKRVPSPMMFDNLGTFKLLVPVSARDLRVVWRELTSIVSRRSWLCPRSLVKEGRDQMRWLELSSGCTSQRYRYGIFGGRA